jgi:integrase
VVKQRSAETKVIFGYAIDEWLCTADIETSTRDRYVGYIERVIRPNLGGIPVNKLESGEGRAETKAEATRTRSTIHSRSSSSDRKVFKLDQDWGNPIWLVTTTGIRRGEAAGLRWSRIDLDGEILEIRRSYMMSKARAGEGHEDTPNA